MDYIDSRGTEIYFLCYLVKKAAFEDGSYRFKPEEAYYVSDWELYCAEQHYIENPISMRIETLIFRDGYVIVDKSDFDDKSMARAIAKKEDYKQQQRKKIYAKQKVGYDKSLTRKSWWRRLFS